MLEIARPDLAGNTLLSAVGERALADLQKQLKRVSLRSGESTSTASDPIERLLFPCTGMISLVAELESGERIEVGRIGKQGVLGGAVLFGGRSHLHSSCVRIPGDAWALAPDAALRLAEDNAVFRTLVFGNEQFLSAQAQQTAACNAKHTIVRRLATRLLRIHDLSGTRDVFLTQEQLGEMLGVQRPSVSMAAAELQNRGLIEYRRGRISIADRSGLEAEACECHAAFAEQEKRCFPPADPMPLQVS
jgi:CRP-like cAMP-binding protein